MKEIIAYSHGKINLSLDVLFKREDGYHEIESVMQEISLKDKLTFRKRDKGILIESNSPHIPLDFHNLVYKVWQKMKLYTKTDRGIYIYIEKNIPVSAGLAGGSSNAAVTFKALNELWDLDLSTMELMDIAKTLGADIPFCIMGGTAIAKGIGEELTPVSPLKGLNILLCNPGFEVSTPYAYSKLDLNSERIDTNRLIRAIEKKDVEDISEGIKNKMERAIIKEYPVIETIKNSMIENGALASLMSGSGPTVFGIFKETSKMEYAKEKLIESFPQTFCAKTV